MRGSLRIHPPQKNSTVKSKFEFDFTWLKKSLIKFLLRLIANLLARQSLAMMAEPPTNEGLKESVFLDSMCSLRKSCQTNSNALQVPLSILTDERRQASNHVGFLLVHGLQFI
jgi:hypothetical protein